MKTEDYPKYQTTKPLPNWLGWGKDSYKLRWFLIHKDNTNPRKEKRSLPKRSNNITSSHLATFSEGTIGRKEWGRGKVDTWIYMGRGMVIGLL